MKKVVVILVVCFFIGTVLYACGGMRPFTRTVSSSTTSTQDTMSPLDVPDLPPTVDDNGTTQDQSGTNDDTSKVSEDETLVSELGKLNKDISSAVEQTGAKIKDVTTTTTTTTSTTTWGLTNGRRTIIQGKRTSTSSSTNYSIKDIQLKDAQNNNMAFIPMVL